MLCWYGTISKNFAQSCLESKQRMSTTNFWFYFQCDMLQYFDWLYPTHSLVVLVNEKWLWDYNFSLSIFTSSLYNWNGLAWITIWCSIHWLVVFPSDYGKFITFGGSTIHSTTFEFIHVFLFCYGAITTLIFLTVPEAPILFEAKKFRR